MHYTDTEYTQTSFLEDHPASPFPSRALGGRRLILATGGPKCSAAYGSAGPVGLLLKTLVASSIWRSTLYSLTWKVRATKQGRLYCRLSPSARPIAGIGASLWLTPSAEDGKHGGDRAMAEKWARGEKIPTTHQRLRTEVLTAWPTPTVSNGGRTLHHVDEWRGQTPYHGGKKVQVDLAHAVKAWPTVRASDGAHGGPNQRDSSGNAGLPGAVMWPTPSVHGNHNAKGSSPNAGDGLATAVKAWPTPRASDRNGAGKHGDGGDDLRTAVAWATPAASEAKTGLQDRHPRAKGTQINLTTQARLDEPKNSGGQLNPAWVEALMGFPPGHTE